jgi:hypothetical protein
MRGMYPSRFALVVIVIAVAWAAPAAGQVEHHYDRAFAYWRVPGLDAERCPSGPIAEYDDPFVRARGALALGQLGGCLWWFGDDFLALDAATRCAVVTHELGHLLGLPDGVGDPRDPLGVMGPVIPVPECASLTPPAPAPPAVVPVIAAAPAPAAVVTPRAARAACIARANRRRTGALRRLARLTCTDRYRAATRRG